MYEKNIKNEFGLLNKENFIINRNHNRLFVCGGKVDITETKNLSFRNIFFNYTADKKMPWHVWHDDLFYVESFKDYFKQYQNLLNFENDIANISTFIIIFLESEGSLVEFGLFCDNPKLHKKLLIIVPQEEILTEDSFIFLGPLKYMEKINPESILYYPWINKEDSQYDEVNLSDLCSIIDNKLKSQNKTEKFDENNDEHIILLIHEIILLCYPIQLSEIKIALEESRLNVSHQTIERFLYLLMKINLIKYYRYSSNTYYYPITELHSVTFGKNKNNSPTDYLRINMNMKQSFVQDHKQSSKRRVTALNAINKLIKGGSK